MGNSVTQNSQRGLIFFAFLSFTIFFVISVVNLVKNRLDPVQDDEEGGEAYKDEGKGPDKPTKEKKEGKEPKL